MVELESRHGLPVWKNFDHDSRAHIWFEDDYWRIGSEDKFLGNQWGGEYFARANFAGSNGGCPQELTYQVPPSDGKGISHE